MYISGCNELYSGRHYRIPPNLLFRTIQKLCIKNILACVPSECPKICTGILYVDHLLLSGPSKWKLLDLCKCFSSSSSNFHQLLESSSAPNPPNIQIWHLVNSKAHFSNWYLASIDFRRVKRHTLTQQQQKKKTRFACILLAFNQPNPTMYIKKKANAFWN